MQRLEKTLKEVLNSTRLVLSVETLTISGENVALLPDGR